MLGWSQEDLAARANVSLPSIKRIESKAGQVSMRVDTLLKIQSAIESNGIEFLFLEKAVGLLIKTR